FLDDILHEALRGRVLDHLGCHYVPAVLQHIASSLTGHGWPEYHCSCRIRWLSGKLTQSSRRRRDAPRKALNSGSMTRRLEKFHQIVPLDRRCHGVDQWVVVERFVLHHG